MLENQKSKELRFYSLAAVLLVCCLILPIAAAVALSQPPNSDATPTPIPSEQPINTAAPSPTPNASDTAPSTPEPTPASNSSSTLLTEDEARQLAMPYIERYATEHNRTIRSINATFYLNSRDISGQRMGNSNPFEPIGDPQNMLSYPEWSIEAFFERTDDSWAPNHMPSSAQGWVYGYCVLIWADNGQIRSANVQALM